MDKDFFHRYNYYTLEHKVPENEFIGILDGIPNLNKSVKPFIKAVIDLIFKSIKENRTKEAVPSLEIPDIEMILANALKGNFYYDIYCKGKPKSKLAETVFKKFLSRIFGKDGFNDEKHIIQNYIHSWLEKRLALGIVADERFNSVKVLTSLIRKTEMLHSLYAHLVQHIPNSWIQDNKKDWVSVSMAPENILDSVRTFDKEYFINYLSLLRPYGDAELWDYVTEVTQGSDYAMLNEEFSFRSSILIKNDLLLWIKFWDNLKLPILQDCAFTSFFDFNPQRYIEVADALVSDKIKVKSDLNFLLLLVAKNYYDASFRLTEKLSFYEDEDRIKPEKENFFKAGQVYYAKWNKEKSGLYSKLIKTLQLKLNNIHIEDWVFSYKPRGKNNNNINKSIELHNTEISLLTEAYKSSFIISEEFSFESFNLPKFNFYVQVIQETGKNELAEILLNALLEYLTSDKFFWDKSYSEPEWSTLKGMGYLISLHAHPIEAAKELIEKFKVVHQGWKPAKIDYRPITIESFIYCGITLLFEHKAAFKNKKQKELFFKELLEIIVIQDRYSQVDNSEYYQQPLHLLFLVSCQILFAFKEYFELEMIKEYDCLYSLLSILSSEEGGITGKSKNLLKNRLEKEFIIEKRKYSNKNQKDKVLLMEEMIKVLAIPN